MTATALRRALCVAGLVLALLLPAVGLTHAHAHGSADHCAVCKTLHAPALPALAPGLVPPAAWPLSAPAPAQRWRAVTLPRPTSRGPPHGAHSA